MDGTNTSQKHLKGRRLSLAPIVRVQFITEENVQLQKCEVDGHTAPTAGKHRESNARVLLAFSCKPQTHNSIVAVESPDFSFNLFRESLTDMSRCLSPGHF